MRRFTHVLERLRGAGLRPTRQRMALAKLLFEGGGRHVTAEMLHKETMAEGIRVSLATVYNSLHQFTEAGLLREIVVDSGRSYFDTTTHDHHHFYFEESGELKDIPEGSLEVVNPPKAPEGYMLDRIDVIVRVKEI